MEKVLQLVKTCISDDDLRADFLNKFKALPEKRNSEYQLKRVKKLKISQGDKRTSYPGIKIDCSKPFAIITGRENTGKTTTFDKLRHFFVLFHEKISDDKKWRTKLSVDFVLIDDSNHQYIIQVDYNSGSSPKSEIFIFEESKLFGKQKVEDSDKFLTENSIVNTQLQDSKFIGESIKLIRLLSTKDSLEEFFYSHKYKMIKNIITEELQRNRRRLSGLNDLINEKCKIKKQVKNRDEEIKREIRKIENLISLKSQINDLQNQFNKEEKIRVKLDSVRNEIRSLTKKRENIIQNLDIFEEELKRVTELQNNTKSFEEVFIESRPLICFVCDQPIPESKVKTRISKNLCYSCGENDLKEFYEEERSNFMIDDFAAEIESINSKINTLKENIKEIDIKIISIKNEMEIKGKIPLDGLYYSLSYSKDEIRTEFNERRESLKRLETRLKLNNELLNRIKNEITYYKYRVGEINDKINQIEVLENTFKKFVESQIQNNVEFLLKRVNYYFGRYSGGSLGIIVIRNNKLQLAQYFDDSEKKPVIFKSIRRENLFSNVTKRKLEISFSLAFQDYIINNSLKDEPKFLIIDSFDDFKPDIRTEIINDLEILVQSGYQVILFANIIHPKEIEILDHTMTEITLHENLRPMTLDFYHNLSSSHQVRNST